MKRLKIRIFEARMETGSMRFKAHKIVQEMLSKLEPQNLEELREDPRGGIQSSLENLLKENVKKKSKGSQPSVEETEMPDFEHLFAGFETLFNNFDWQNYNEEAFEKAMTPYLKQFENALTNDLLEKIDLDKLSETSSEYLEKSLNTKSVKEEEPEDLSKEDLKMLKRLLEKSPQNLYYIEMQANEMTQIISALKDCEPRSIRERVYYSHVLDRLCRFDQENAPICPISENELKALQSAKQEHKKIPLDF